jgi:hypothetical protein
MSSSSHSPDRISVTFDDDHAVANAGLIQSPACPQHGLDAPFRGSLDWAAHESSTIAQWCQIP